ncbi:MAG: nucleotidyltransferase domain-containing protein [Proteobacteria bacterium]|nr:nucleotidyltransferase domain-containing protein [Pseudomonadota bacterium]
MNTANLNIIKQYLRDNGVIKFAYLFGSCVRNEDGPLSDIDLAVYLDNRVDFFSTRLLFFEEINRLLKGHPVDLVVLNNTSLVLQYEAIRDSIILKEDKKRRILFETGVLREYLDTEPIRAVHRQKLKKSFIKEHSLGQ